MTKIRDDSMDLDSVVKGKGKNKFSGFLPHLWQGRPQVHRVLVKRQFQAKVRVEIRMRM